MGRFCGRECHDRGAGRIKRVLAAAAGTLLLTMGAPALAETYRMECAGVLPLREDHGELVNTFGSNDHEPAGWGSVGKPNNNSLRYALMKLWPDSTYYCIGASIDSMGSMGGFSAFSSLADDRYFSFSYRAVGGGKRILESADMVLKRLPPLFENSGGLGPILEGLYLLDDRSGVLKLVTGHDTSDDEFLFRLIGKFRVKENADLSALEDLRDELGADELFPGDVIEMDFGRFVVGNRKTASNDPERDAGEYAMVWDPAEADRNTLLFETENGPLLELRMKGSTDTGVVYIKLNTSWKPFEDAGFLPEQTFPGGDAALYSFESTNNLLDDTSRADLYIHNHPDTVLGGESMTERFADGRLYIYDAVISDDGKVSLIDISEKITVGIVDGEKALCFKGRALNNIIISTVPLADATPQARAGEAVQVQAGGAARQPANTAAQIGKLLAGKMED